MARRSSSTPEVLLGLLSVESMSGYALGRAIRDSVGHFWNESYGQIYPTLKALAIEGFVSCKKEGQKNKPDRRIYSITKKGRERLRIWLAAPPQPEIPRNELLLKVFFGEQVSPEILIRYVEHMAQEQRAVLAFLERAEREELEKHRHYPAARYWRMAVRFGQMEMRAHLRWAQETLRELNNIANEQRNHSVTRKEKRHGSD